MKNILGLDLGTNSIGWAVINSEEDGPIVKKKNRTGRESDYSYGCCCIRKF